MDVSHLEIFPEIGKVGVKKLARSCVTIVGVGALGTATAETLARSGIGKLVLIDRDIVEKDNLGRQRLYMPADVGMPKALACARRLSEIFSEIKIEHQAVELVASNAYEILAGGLVVDCTDNFTVRRVIDSYSISKKKSWVHGACQGSVGNVKVFEPGGPCFSCIFGDREPKSGCHTDGILPATSAITAAMQATLALQLILGKKYDDKLLRVNTWSGEHIKIAVKKAKGCLGCSRKKVETAVHRQMLMPLCGHLFQARTNLSFLSLKNQLKDVKLLGKGVMTFGPFTIFSDGRILIKAKSEKRALALLHENFKNI